MKQTSQNINIIIQNDNIINFKEIINSRNYDFNREYQEESLGYYIDLFESSITILKDLLKNDNVFESISSYLERQQIYSFLKDLANNLNNMKSGYDTRQNICSIVLELNKILSKYHNLVYDKDSKLIFDKLGQIRKLLSNYKSIEKKTSNIDSMYTEIEELLNGLKHDKQESELTLENIKSLNNSSETNKQEINKNYDKVIETTNNISKYEQKALSEKDSINNFFTEINHFKSDMNEGLNKIEKNIEKNDTRTELIINKNIELQDQIMDILGKAIGTNLYKAFNEKSNNLKKYNIRWLVGVIATIIVFLICSGGIVYWISLNIKGLNWQETAIAIITRLSLLFAPGYLLYFVVSQYNYKLKLKEEYDFKSAVAVSLHHFKDIVVNTDGDLDKNFLVDSITKIFESPTDKVFNKQTSLSDTLKTTGNIIKQVKDVTGTSKD